MPSPVAPLAASPVEAARQARQAGLWQRLGRDSRQLMYRLAMRAGGEPFGAPFEVGLSSLTERAVRVLKQRGFYGFETLEALGERRERNKFTRHGASRYRGPYRTRLLPAVVGSRVGRLLALIEARLGGGL